MKSVLKIVCAAAFFFLSALCAQAADAKMNPPKPDSVAACTIEMGLRYALPAKAAAKAASILGGIDVRAAEEGTGKEFCAETLSPLLRVVLRDQSDSECAYVFCEGRIMEKIGGQTQTYAVSPAQMRNAVQKLASLTADYLPDNLLGAMAPDREDAAAAVFSADGLYYAPAAPYGESGRLSGAAKLGDAGNALSDLDTLEISSRAWKARYELCGGGVRLRLISRYEWEDVTFPAYSVILPKDEYGRFLQSLRAEYKSASKSPAWLGLINPRKIQSADLTPSDRSQTVSQEADEETGWLLLNTCVEEGSGRRVTDPALDGGTIRVRFYNGAIYTVEYSDTALTIHSSDMAYSLSYGFTKGAKIDRFIASRIDRENGVRKPDPGLKPVVYLYPETERDVHVRLDYWGDFTCTDPAYGADGWRVRARPDGRLTDRDGAYDYLFWEGVPWKSLEIHRGSVVPGERTQAYLRETLSAMGLTPREYREFISFWAPKMENNPYNLISFAGKEYEESARLTVTPEPDSVLRVHMVWKALDKPVEIEPQEYRGFERRGFTVVEWGGTEITG